MGNRSDGLIMSEARDRAAIDNLEDASFGPGRGVGSLVENAPHLAVAVRRSVAVVHTSTLVVARANTHPRGELLCRRKSYCRGTDFGNDLLRGIDTQARYLRQPLNRVMVLAEFAWPFLGPVGRSVARGIATARVPSSAADGTRA